MSDILSSILLNKIDQSQMNGRKLNLQHQINAIQNRNKEVLKGDGTAGKKNVDSEKTDPLKHACEEFESLFVQHLMKVMRETIPKDGLIPRGSAEEIYTGMLDTQISKDIASNGGMGLSSMLYHQLRERAIIEEK